MAGCGGPVASHCAPASHAPVALSDAHRRSPVVGANAGDTVAAAWESDTGGAIQVRIRRIDDSGDVWGPAVELGGPGGRAPSVAVTPGGTVFVAWREDTTTTSTVRLAGATDTGWAQLSTGNVPLDGADAAQVAADGSERPTLIVRRRRDDGTAALLALQPGVDDGAQTLTSVPSSIDDPQLSVAPDGTAVVAWRQSARAPGVYALVRPPGGRWGRPTRISSTASGIDLVLAAEPDGVATVLWTAFDDAGARVETRAFDGARWHAATTLDRGTGRAGEVPRPGFTNRRPTMVRLPDGIAAAWPIRTPDGTVIRAAIRDRSGKWAAPTTIAGPGGAVGSVALATGPGGVALAGWEEIDGGLLRVRTSPLATSSTCTDLSGPTTEAADIRMVASATPTAVYVDVRRGRVMAVDLR